MEENTQVTGQEQTAGTQASESTAQGQEPLSFDDMLKNKEYQSEFDKRVQKAIATAQTKWDAGADERIRQAVEEATKTAKMTAEQKAQHEREKKDKELSEREASITKRELQATAREQLIERGLPSDLYQTLDYTDSDSCTKSIEALEKAFNGAVEKAVDDRVKKTSSTPKEGDPTVKDPFLEGLGL